MQGAEDSSGHQTLIQALSPAKNQPDYWQNLKESKPNVFGLNFVYFAYPGSLFENIIFRIVKVTDLTVAMGVKKS